MSKIKGGDLMLFISGVSIGYATSHTLSINGETQDTSNKDEGGGDWAASEVSKLSWTVSTENLYSGDQAGKGYDDLFALMIAKTPVEVVFAQKSESTTNVGAQGWTPKLPKYKGNAAITSLSLNAPNGEYATFSCELTGVGALSKVTV